MTKDPLNRECPYCSGELEVERLRCCNCNVAIEGQIRLPRLARLSVEDREFIELFVRSSGSLKAVAAKLGISYPTVRQRLNRVIENLELEDFEERDQRRAILDAIESGTMSVEDAIEALRDL